MTEATVAVHEARSPRLFEPVSMAKESAPRYERILVAIDLSPASEKALTQAVALASECHSTLTIFHVIDISAEPTCGGASALMKRLWEKASSRMKQLAEVLKGRLDARTVIEEGLPWEKIIEKSAAFDLLILGKRRSGSIGRFFSSRTTQRVIKHSACPVMLAG